MEKKTTLSVYRSYKEGFDDSDLALVAKELSQQFECEVQIVSVMKDDGEELMFVISGEDY